jgi:thiol:disulfide interchange protein DsbC
MATMKLLLPSVVVAALVAAAAADEGAVRATLRRVFPQSPVQSIAATPIPGVLEAAVGGQVLYITEDGRYILGGPLIDFKTNQNLTDARLEKLDAIPFDSLPLDWAIKRVQGKGTRRIAIFEDPDCPYCKKLEDELKGIDDLTIYVLLYPIDEIHPGATAKSKAVWCAKDRLKAWDEVMRTAAAPGTTDCDTPVAKIVAFGRQHRITVTPTTILPDGRRLLGAAPRADLERQLLKSTGSVR